MDKLTKYMYMGVHITLGRFVDLSVTVEGLHRAGQDDWDSHAERYDTRIIRASTRMSSFTSEVSDWYKDRIIPTDAALTILGITAPSEIEVDGVVYIKGTNGYIREEFKDDPDAKRGLYMLSIPSNFIFKVNLTEFAHVYKQRNKHGHAHPEVKELCESICDQLQEFQPMFNRELLDEIQN